MAKAIYSKVAEFMTDSVTFNAKSATNKYNQRTFAGQTRTVTGRLIFETRLTKDDQGREQVELGRFITNGPPATAISISDKMTISGNRVVIIHSVDPIDDENGNHHTVVRFGL